MALSRKRIRQAIYVKALRKAEKESAASVTRTRRELDRLTQFPTQILIHVLEGLNRGNSI